MAPTGTIGKRLAAIRQHRSILQTELAAAIGVSKATISHYEHGRAEIKSSRLENLARALHCELADLLAPLNTPLPRARFRAGAAEASAHHITPAFMLQDVDSD